VDLHWVSVDLLGNAVVGGVGDCVGLRDQGSWDDVNCRNQMVYRARHSCNDQMPLMGTMISQTCK